MYILAFIAGAAVFGAGFLSGAAVVTSNYDKILKSGQEDE